jgi:O-antigen/teichoic acid export membrane protein
MKDYSQRSKLLYKNIIASIAIKGYAAIISLMLVPLTLNCLGTLKNGVWLTISSILLWIDQMDIGLGNGLRNRLAIHIAHQEIKEARQTISSTIAMLTCIVFPLLIVLLLLAWNTDVYGFLNILPEEIPELRLAILYAIIFVCLTFVMKFIGNFYMGMQLPAISNLLISLGQTIILIVTWVLYVNGKATFLSIAIANTASPLLIYFLAYTYTFYIRFPKLRPSFHLINLKSALELGNLGLKFFWIQIASVIQFLTTNLLISKFYTPALVTPYQIAYRYISLSMVIFTIICMPFWNATTDAYERNDIVWIRKANQKMNWMIAGIAVLLSCMVIVSPWVYQIWIGDACQVPIGITIMVALYNFLLIISMRYSYFLNGIGALRLQTYMTVMTIIFIPSVYLVCTQTNNILWLIAVMCICVTPSFIVNMIQFHKLLNGTATGIWKK